MFLHVTTENQSVAPRHDSAVGVAVVGVKVLGITVGVAGVLGTAVVIARVLSTTVVASVAIEVIIVGVVDLGLRIRPDLDGRLVHRVGASR